MTTIRKGMIILMIFLCCFAQTKKIYPQNADRDPFKKIKPVKRTLEQLPLGDILPGGWLKEELLKNMNGFTGNLDSLVPDLILNDDIYGKNRLTRKIKSKNVGAVAEEGDWQVQYLWWNSETQSNWLDGYMRTAVLLGDKKQLFKTAKIIRRLLGTQDDDGYIGIYDKELRYKFDNENGELWSKATLYRALLGWYEFTKDKTILAAVEKAVDNLMQAYTPDRSHPFYSVNPNAGGLTHGLAFTDVLEHLYMLTKNQLYMDYCLFMYRDFSEQLLNEDAQYAKLTDMNLPLKGHGVHTYEHLRSLAAAAYASGNSKLEKALNNFIEKIKAVIAPSGAPIGDEFIAGRTADASIGYEYCSLQELIAGWISLLSKKAGYEYGDKAEHLFFNAALGNTHPTESGICYLKQDNAFILTWGNNGDTTDKHQTRYRYSPVHREAAVCCVPNAGRIVPYYIQNMWMKDKDGLVATLLGPCNLNTNIGTNQVSVKEETSYPFSNGIRFIINCKQPAAFSIKIRKPVWATAISASLPYKESEGFIVFKQSWAEQTGFTISFSADIIKKETTDKMIFFENGPLVLCRVIEAEEQRTRSYGIAGLHEFIYKPIQADQFQYDNDTVTKAALAENTFFTRMINLSTGKKEQVTLVPMAKTILRQAAFKIKE